MFLLIFFNWDWRLAPWNFILSTFFYDLADVNSLKENHWITMTMNFAKSRFELGNDGISSGGVMFVTSRCRSEVFGGW